MNLFETKKILTSLSAVYSNFILNEATPQIWCELLKDFNYEDVKLVSLKYMREAHQFAPTPGDLISLIKDEIINYFTSPEEAWEQIMILTKNVNQINFQSIAPEIQRAMKGIGWFKVAYADLNREIPWLRKEFIKAYSEEILYAANQSPHLLLLQARQMGTLSGKYSQSTTNQRQGREVLRAVFKTVANKPASEALQQATEMIKSNAK